MSIHLRTFALVISAGFVTATIGFAQAPGKKSATSARGNSAFLAKAHELRAAYSKAQEDSVRDASQKELRTLVGGARQSLDEVIPALGERESYVRLVLNERGLDFDAFRFRVPAAGQTYRMYMALAAPGKMDDQPLDAVGIFEVDGDDLMFTYPAGESDVTLTGANLPTPNWWSHYRLYGQKLRAGKEYVIWFNFKATRPLPLFVRLRIEPIEPVEPPHTPALQTARTTFQSALAKLNEKYDADTKANRRKFFGEVEKAARFASKKANSHTADFIAEEERANLGDSEANDPRGFHIVRAEIGVNDQWNDVTAQVRGLVRDSRLKMTKADYELKTDPAFGVHKTLIIIYTVDGKPGIYTAQAEQDVDLPPATK